MQQSDQLDKMSKLYALIIIENRLAFQVDNESTLPNAKHKTNEDFRRLTFMMVLVVVAMVVTFRGNFSELQRDVGAHLGVVLNQG